MRYPIIAGLLLCFGPATFVRAQTVNEATLSAGIYSRYRAQELHKSNNLFNGPLEHNYQRSNVKDAGAYFLSYQRWLVPQFTLGFTAGIEQERGDFGDNSNNTVGTYRRRSLSVALEVRYYYVRRGAWRVYSMAGAGPRIYQLHNSYYSSFGGTTVLNEFGSEMNISPTYQVSPLGVRYGRRLGGFAEIGWGYKGILNIGAALRF